MPIAAAQSPEQRDQATTGPVPSDVFREYHWVPEGGLHVLHHWQKPIALPHDVDLHLATRAELVVEISNTHLGFNELSVSVNGQTPHALPFPATAPTPAADWFHQWSPVAHVAIAELRAGTPNELLFAVGRSDEKGWHQPFTCIYGTTLRVYYDGARVRHAAPAAAVTSPRAEAVLGEQVELMADAGGCDAGRVVRVDYLGFYEDANCEGDGRYTQWHYSFVAGQLMHHLGSSSDGPTCQTTWDTTWVPDQSAPMRIAARITDETGLIRMTEAVEGLALGRVGRSVELCRPYDVPKGFTSCQYGCGITQGPRTQHFDVHGDLGRIIDARFVVNAWNMPGGQGFVVNGRPLTDLPQRDGRAGARWLYRCPLRPLSVLRSGQNEFSTLPGPMRCTDIHWPGVAVLVRYDTTGEPMVRAPLVQPAPRTPAPVPHRVPLIASGDVVNCIGMALRTIEPGAFMMGTPEGTPERMWEEPLHRVTLTQPLRIGVTPVTQAQWRKVMGTSPSYFAGDDLPAEQISWFDAVTFCERLSELDGRRYRLPTEAEWEYACRAGTTTVFSTGQTLADDQANFNGAYSYAGGPTGLFRGRTTPVGSFDANPWGLSDVHGNVWEWCADWYAQYPAGDVMDPVGPDESGRLEPTRILRGGAWNAPPGACRSAFRFRLPPACRYYFTGLRVAAAVG